MKSLKVLLWICGIVCLLAIPSMVIPWAIVEKFFRWFGLEPIPSSPLLIYMYRIACAFSGLIGVFFIILARDPLRYRAMVILSIWGLIFIGLVCLISGLTVGMQPPWYIIDVAFCLVLGVLIGILWLKASATTKKI